MGCIIGKDIMKVIQNVAGIDGESSGTSYAVPGLCRALKRNEVDVTLLAPGKIPDLDYGFSVHGFERNDFPFVTLGRATGMLRYLRQNVHSVDVVHTNGLWLMTNVYPYWATRKTGCKFVIQPHGTLSRWALRNSRWKKRLFGWVMQYDAMRHADMWVATADTEYEDIRRLGYRQPVCVLPNGIDLPSEKEVEAMKVGRTSRRRMYFLSRIHPKKNVDLLLKVWARLEHKFPDWDLSIVGPDKGNPYADAMKGLAKGLGCRRVSFEGEIIGEAKLKFVAKSECVVLPTFSENFGMVIAEALACGVPAICSHGAPWEGLNTEKCGWWVPTTEQDFERALSEAMLKSREELVAMGGRGREWMQRDFSWDGIGMKMKVAYEWLCNGGECPKWVRQV